MAHEAKAKTITEAQFNMFMQAVRDVEARYDSDYIKFWENIFYCASELGLRSIETCRHYYSLNKKTKRSLKR